MTSKTIQQIYEHYQIPDHLQDHMYQVAAVGTCIAQHWKNPSEINASAITTALLLHDMGNILKFDLHSGNHMLRDTSPESISHWQQVQDHIKKTYGTDSHTATINIVKELGQPATITSLIEVIDSNQIATLLPSQKWTAKIVDYSDVRVSPQGITSLEIRFEDLMKRYPHKMTMLQATLPLAQALETQLNQKAIIDIRSIDQSLVASLLSSLPNWSL